VLEFWQQRSGGSHGRCYHGASEPVVEHGSFGQTRRLVKRSRPVSAIPFGRLVLQVRGPDQIGAFQATSMKTKKLIQSSRGPKASRHNKSKRQCWKVVHPHAAGIDVGATEHYVAVPPDSVPAEASTVRSFGCFTEEIEGMVEWLKACGVDTVAMESTGVYWMVPFQKLEEAGMQVVLVMHKPLSMCPDAKPTSRTANGYSNCTVMGCCERRFGPMRRPADCGRWFGTGPTW